MATYVISYFGGDQPATPEEGKQHFARYQKWLASLGDACISPMNPLRNTHVVSPDGSVSQGSQCGMSGYTLVEADSIEAALAMAQECPFLAINGTLEVSELVKMPG